MFPNARSFLRVRPFTPVEAITNAYDSPVPRGILQRNAREGTVTVLDPQNRYKPKRNSTFTFGADSVLWSFQEDDVPPDGPVADLNDVYETCMKPVIPSIVQGYNAAFLVTGAQDSGKFATAYGYQFAPAPVAAAANEETAAAPNNIVASSNTSDSVPSTPVAAAPMSPSAGAAQRSGIFFRFCEDLLDAFSKSFHENSAQLSVEVEVVEIANEQYNDLLNAQAHPNTSGAARSNGAMSSMHHHPRSASVASRPQLPASASDVEPIKVVMDPIEGARLSGVTRATVVDAEQLEQVVRLALRQLKKRKSTHYIHLRFTETFQFSDSEREGHSITKARRINVLFSVLCSPPPSFHRCIDVAIERDTGENVNAMVPYRDSAFAKLYADVFMHGYHLTFVNCVSPFYEHVKDAIATIPFALKVRKLRCNPKLTHDERLVELRRLADEVKGLRTEVTKQNESMVVVQQELDRREHEILRKETIHQEQLGALEECRARRAVDETGAAVQRMRNDKRHFEAQSQLATLEKELSKKQAALKTLTEETTRISAQRDDVAKKAAELEELRKEHEAILKPFTERIERRRMQEAELKRLEDFIAAEPEQRKREVSEAYELRQTLHEAIAKLEVDKKASRTDLGEAKIRTDEVKPQYDEVVAKDNIVKGVADAKQQRLELELEIRRIDEENLRLQDEIDKAPKGGCCSVM